MNEQIKPNAVFSNHFDEYVAYRALSLKHDTQHLLLRSLEENLPGRHVQTVIGAKMHEDLERVIGLLGMTKRQFIELALHDTIGRAEKLIDDLKALPEVGK